MNQTAQEAWFYTREGERLGPVSLADLRIKAVEGTLHPRLDMVWTQGMAEWKPAGEIDGLFERRTVVEELAAAPAAPDPYAAPAHAEAAEMLATEGGWPGARRRSFYLMTMVFPFVWNLGFAAAGAFLRLANVGMSRWWYLGNLVPILNLWVGYRMYVCPAGYAYHKKLDTAGVVLAILYWLMIIMALLAVLAVIAVLFGMAGSPELRLQFDEAIREAMRRQSAGL
ncbi:MAG: DUF4339 domain-containing protein [Akkermansiaceae bacterium]|nr:DUF4339 domain-containing protein [Akkermansiaceae bacterium]